MWIVEVRGEWGGVVGSWRPAITGTINQTGRSDEWASTCETLEEARGIFDGVIVPELPDDDNRHRAPRFRYRDLETGDTEST